MILPLCRHLRFPLRRELLLESVLMAVFMLSGWYGSYLSAICLYGAGYVLYLLLENRLVRDGIRMLKQEMKENYERSEKCVD